MDCCIWCCALISQSRSNIQGLSPGSCCQLFPVDAPWQLSLWLGGVPSTDPAGEGGSWKKEQVLHTDCHSQRAPSRKHWLQPQSWIFHAERVVLISRNKTESKGRTESFYCLSLQQIKEQVLWGFRLQEEFEVLLWGAQKDVPQCLKGNAALFHCASD